ncbi:SWPV1-026 [Shearwaterpox virus]|uniref:SWPV1-026 n=1 Tax=Shearwaterpox virus TaxID=1974596 RepID=A0A1V0S7P0_CNPV|nr:SWPV1-026 [Shearwaterpox virus]
MRKKRRNKCCKIFLQKLTSISIKMYEIYENNKHIVCSCVYKCKKICKNFFRYGNTCIYRLKKYLIGEIIKTTTKSLVSDPLGLGKKSD